MNAFQKFFSNLLGRRKEDEEEQQPTSPPRAQSKSLSSEAIQQISQPVAPRVPEPTPTPEPQPLRRLNEPPAPNHMSEPASTRPTGRHGQPLYSAEEIERNAQIEARKFADDNPFTSWLTNSRLGRDVVAPTITGAAQATLGAAGFGMKYLPGFSALDRASGDKGERFSDRINEFALDQRETVNDHSELKIPEWVPLVGDQNPFLLASEMVVDPANAIPGLGHLSRARRFGAGVGAGAISGLIQPAANEADRLRNILFGGGFGGTINALPGTRPNPTGSGAASRTLSAADSRQVLNELTELPSTAIDSARQQFTGLLDSKPGGSQAQGPVQMPEGPGQMPDPTLNPEGPQAPVQAPPVQAPDPVQTPPVQTPDLPPTTPEVPPAQTMNPRPVDDVELELQRLRQQQEAANLEAQPDQPRQPQPEPVAPEQRAVASADAASEGAIPNPANALPENPAPVFVPGSRDGGTSLSYGSEDGGAAPMTREQMRSLGDIFKQFYGDDALAFKSEVPGGQAGAYTARDNQAFVKNSLTPMQGLKVTLHEGMHKAVNTLLSDKEIDVIRQGVRAILDRDPNVKKAYLAQGYHEIELFEEVAADAIVNLVTKGRIVEPQGAMNVIADAINTKMGNLQSTNPQAFNQIMVSVLKVLRGIFESVGDQKNLRLMDELYKEIANGSLVNRYPVNRYLEGYKPLAGSTGEGLARQPYNQAVSDWRAARDGAARDEGISQARVSASSEQPGPDGLNPQSRADEPPRRTNREEPGRAESNTSQMSREAGARRQAEQRAAGGTEKVAPNVRQGIDKQYKTSTRDLYRNVAHDNELTAKYRTQYKKKDVDDIIRNWTDSEATPDTMFSDDPKTGIKAINTVEKQHEALAALDRLKDVDTPEARLAMQDISYGLMKGTSEGAQVMSLWSRAFNNLPAQTRSDMTLAKVNQLREKANMSKLSKEESKQVVDQLTEAFEKATERTAAVQEVIERYDAKKTPDINSKLLGEKADADRLLQEANGEIHRVIDTILPSKNILTRMANYDRVMMLTSFTGRANDTLSTSSNAMYTVLRSILEAPISRTINKSEWLSRSQKATDSTSFNRTMLPSLKAGFKDATSALRGRVLAGATYSPDQAHRAGQSNLIRAGAGNLKSLTGAYNLVKNTTTGMVQFPTYVTRFVKDTEVYRLGLQEAKAAGLKGEAAENFAIQTSLNPPEKIRLEAQKLQDEVNNLNSDNWLNRRLQNAFRRSAGDGPVAEGVTAQVKNQISPFIDFAANFAWNAVTRHNVFAALANTGLAVKRGDARELSRSLADLSAQGALTYGAYTMAQNGMLSAVNQDGYPDGGPYLVVGDKFYSVAALGTIFGTQMAVGLAMSDAMNAEGNDSFGDAFVGSIANSMKNILHLTGAQDMVGGSGSGLLADIQSFTDGRMDFGQAALRATLRPVAQKIPALTSNINAFLNQTSLNPTKERAETKVTNYDGSVDRSATEFNRLQNRIPGLSQQLPRQEGVMANTLIDQIFRGGTESTSQRETRDRNKMVEGVNRELKEKGIPSPYERDNNYTERLQSLREEGRYDDVVTALNHELEKLTFEKASKKTIDDHKRSITYHEVARDNEIPYDLLSKYYGSGLDSADTYNTGEFSKLLDPDSDMYNLELASQLYHIDTLMAKAGVSSNTTDRNKNYYKLPNEDGSGGGRGGGSRAVNYNAFATPRVLDPTITPRSLNLASSDRIRPTIARGNTINMRRITVN